MVSFKPPPDPAHVVAQPVEEPVMRLRLVVDARGDLPQHGDAIPHVVDGGVVLALERLRVLFHLHLHRVGVAEETRAASAPGKTGWRWVRRTRQRGEGSGIARGEEGTPGISRRRARRGAGSESPRGVSRAVTHLAALVYTLPLIPRAPRPLRVPSRQYVRARKPAATISLVGA